MTRCKFRVVAVTDMGENSPKKIELAAQYDTSIPVEKRFFSATPTGKVEIHVNNPAVIEAMQVGRSFYADFTPV